MQSYLYLIYLLIINKINIFKDHYNTYKHAVFQSMSLNIRITGSSQCSKRINILMFLILENRGVLMITDYWYLQ